MFLGWTLQILAQFERRRKQPKSCHLNQAEALLRASKKSLYEIQQAFQPSNKMTSLYSEHPPTERLKNCQQMVHLSLRPSPTGRYLHSRQYPMVAPWRGFKCLLIFPYFSTHGMSAPTVPICSKFVDSTGLYIPFFYVTELADSTRGDLPTKLVFYMLLIVSAAASSATFPQPISRTSMARATFSRSAQ